jgi:DNA-binding MarR family transcriptional regulator
MTTAHAAQIQSTNINPRIVELLNVLCLDFVEAYEVEVAVRPRLDRDQHVKLAVTKIVGHSVFSMKSVLEGHEGLNIQRSLTLAALHKLGGKAALGDVVKEMGITRQAAYSRLQAIMSYGYAEKFASEYGVYHITEKGTAAAESLVQLQ